MAGIYEEDMGPEFEPREYPRVDAPTPELDIVPGTPTQLAHPAQATLRTGLAMAIAVIVGIVGLGPLIIDAILQEESIPEGIRGPLLLVSGVIVAIGAIVTRIMAIPGVNDLLKKVGFGTGVEHEAKH